MPPIFQVLRCYKCAVFQVHQTRKDNKWTCKLCGEKQSVKRHYGIGTAKDCRYHVQKLNSMRGEKEEAVKTYISDSSDCDEIHASNSGISNTPKIDSIKKQSKWSAYVDETENLDDNEPQYLNNLEVVLEVPQKRKISSLYSKQINKVKKPIDSVKCNNSINDHFEDITTKKLCNIKSKELPLQENYSKSNLHRNTTKYDNIHIKNLNSQDHVLTSKLSLKQPSVLNSSKWHQYLEEDRITETPSELNENVSTTNSLFSLCDDNDIDKILDL